MDSIEHLYIDLLKRCVSNYIYDDDLDLVGGKMIASSETGKFRSVECPPANPQQKFFGQIWPSRAHTMIGVPRLNNIQYCVEQVLEAGVRGDFIETGVWRGGASIFMRGMLKAYGIADRKVWVADSFEGLPQEDADRYPQGADIDWHKYSDLAVALEQVRTNFDRYGLLDDQVEFLKGWFCDTLPHAPIGELAIMRLDGDLYSSTIDALVNLYPKLSPGGFVIVDDYGAIPSCNDAVNDFRRQRNIAARLEAIPGSGAFWRKELAERQ